MGRRPGALLVRGVGERIQLVVGDDLDARREREGYSCAARKCQFDHIRRPASIGNGEVSHVHTVSFVRQHRAGPSCTEGLLPEIARTWIRGLPQPHLARLVQRQHPNRSVVTLSGATNARDMMLQAVVRKRKVRTLVQIILETLPAFCLWTSGNAEGWGTKPRWAIELGGFQVRCLTN